MTTGYIPPAQLWLGIQAHLELDVLSYLQQHFCKQRGCGLCTTCTQLFEKQHHSVLWIEPEKQYSLEILEPIKAACAFTLEQDEHFFFVLNKAELLSVSCQNSLLKIMEEPPAGYHFILLASLKDPILPTIQSRCIIKQASTSLDTSVHPLFIFFSTSTQQDPSSLLKLLEEHKPSEQESIALINQLLVFWLSEFRRTVRDRESARHLLAQAMINILNDGLLNPPMPGGSALFWKNVYLQLHAKQ